VVSVLDGFFLSQSASFDQTLLTTVGWSEDIATSSNL
jgi:hypothetical protein